MRFIPRERVEARLDGNWIDSAKGLRTELDTAPGAKERKKIIDDNDAVWRGLKPTLRAVADTKCWYCETKADRTDNAVDHFRPKSVYWWLTFDWTNFRYSCTFCNSRRRDPDSDQVGGKQDGFPLADGSARATNPAMVEDEVPLLLDPFVYDDHRMIWFDETGLTKPHPSREGDAEVESRIKASVDLYNLNFAQLAADRRLKYRQVIDLCRDGDKFWTEYETTKSKIFLKSFSDVVVKLVRLIDDREEYSAAALHATLGLRTASATARRALGIDDG